MKKLLVFTFLFPLSLLAQTGYVELKFNLPKSVPYEYVMGMNMKMNQNVMGQDVNVDMNYKYNYVFEVIKDSANWKTVKSTVKSVRMEMTTMGTTMVGDTEVPVKDPNSPDGQMTQVINAMKGSELTFMINNKGDVGKITGFEAMAERMKKSMPQGSQSQMAGMDESSFRQNIQQSFGAYPEKPVKVGDTWEKSVTTKSQGMDILSKNTYTLESVTGDDANVKIVSKLSSNGTMNTGAMTADVVMTGNSNGNMQYIISSGLPQHADLNMKMDMKISTNGMEIPMKMDNKITIQSKKL
ncbi:MAG: hypothetical protein NVS3B19_01880 [Ginsengibacter sp.]